MAKAAPILYRFFNRRGAYRVQPAPESLIDVTLIGGPENISAHGRLMNISTSGVRIRVPLEVESQLAGVHRVTVAIGLPGSPAAPTLPGVIRNRHIAGGQVHYAIQFDLQTSTDARHNLEAVARFVVQRQRQILREMKGAPA